MIRRFRKKPIVLDAIQWTGYNVSELLEWGAPISTHIEGETLPNNELIVKTLEDGSKGQVAHIASVGDWIVRGVLGEYYAIKPNALAELYDEE